MLVGFVYRNLTTRRNVQRKLRMILHAQLAALHRLEQAKAKVSITAARLLPISGRRLKQPKPSFLELIQMLGKPRPLGRGRIERGAKGSDFRTIFGDTVLQGGEDVHEKNGTLAHGGWGHNSIMADDQYVYWLKINTEATLMRVPKVGGE